MAEFVSGIYAFAISDDIDVCIVVCTDDEVLPDFGIMAYWQTIVFKGGSKSRLFGTTLK